jgi:uracil-DNA glycosylase
MMENDALIKVDPVIQDSWKKSLSPEFNSLYFKELKNFLLTERSQNAVIYPPGSLIFNAFDHTSYDGVKVVILGQDPYHGAGQANGLCFSVSPGIKKPPSLVNIFKEIRNDLGYDIPESGDLSGWAKQGVLLLNATLTVKAGLPGSHQKKGWEKFTDSVIKKLSADKKDLVFLLWGRFAQAKEVLIDTSKHHVLKAPHPSPFSAASGFFGCRHFSKTNQILKDIGVEPINWKLID